MPEFTWRAAAADGRLIEGRSEAPAPDAVLRQLRERGRTPIQVGTATPQAAASPALGRGGQRTLKG
ncbi:MAG: type II secretion system F family protein, partial [Burkholderiales bacterium]|nr:type II secretion system F family protein [Burkholderiales bacterium]